MILFDENKIQYNSSRIDTRIYDKKTNKYTISCILNYIYFL